MASTNRQDRTCALTESQLQTPVLAEPSNGRYVSSAPPLAEAATVPPRPNGRFDGLERRGGTGIEGAIEAIGTHSLLQMFHMARLTGALEASHGRQTIYMSFETGRLASALSEEAEGREAVMQFLAWTEGRFTFRPGAPAEGGPILEPTEFLILESCRILDEKLRLGSR
jgi:uncharacterized protein DUF4388